MKYLLAVFAVIAEFFAYSGIITAMNWKVGGGLLVQLLFFAVVGATWRAITKNRNQEKDDTVDECGNEEKTQ